MFRACCSSEGCWELRPDYYCYCDWLAATPAPMPIAARISARAAHSASVKPPTWALMPKRSAAAASPCSAASFCARFKPCVDCKYATSSGASFGLANNEIRNPHAKRVTSTRKCPENRIKAGIVLARGLCRRDCLTKSGHKDLRRHHKNTDHDGDYRTQHICTPEACPYMLHVSR